MCIKGEAIGIGVQGYRTFRAEDTRANWRTSLMKCNCSLLFLILLGVVLMYKVSDM